ncbi:helix-turn-helix transcriptional regulator [Halorarum halobium]|uniref:helix-turn-helix transcriptional regulator n=1 Tax=Halorarum halobium TaxID=3075121 RepID=UPI0028B07081|nr:helix-turn-helix domain-containing protein [Halobaculum sp. XH14]
MEPPDDDRPRSILRRKRLLAACRDDALSRKQLTERTDLSRTTVYRATVALEEGGLLENTGEGYRTTSLGAALLAAGRTYETAVESIGRLEPLLELVDHPALVEHAHLFTGAEVVVADASNPYRVVDHVIDRFGETSGSRGTIVSTTAVEALQRATPALEDRGHIERVFAASALESHETVGGEAFRAVTANENLSILAAPDADVPFSFAIDDADVSVVGHDPATGLPTVHVESDRPAARAWLEALYERCRAAAEPI